MSGFNLEVRFPKFSASSSGETVYIEPGNVFEVKHNTGFLTLLSIWLGFGFVRRRGTKRSMFLLQGIHQ